MKKTICMDFDGVIASCQAWNGAGRSGAPVSGVRNPLKVPNENCRKYSKEALKCGNP